MSEIESYAAVRARLLTRLRGENADGSVQTVEEKVEAKQRALDHYLTQGDAARWALYGDELQLTVRNLLERMERCGNDRDTAGQIHPVFSKAVALLARIR